MNRFLVLLFASVCVLAGLSACEGEAEGDGSASLEAHYVLQQVEVDYTNGDFDIFEDPEDFLYDSEGFYEDYILFDYEYVFERNGQSFYYLLIDVSVSLIILDELFWHYKTKAYLCA